MANQKEKELLGLPATATDDQVEARIMELITRPTATAGSVRLAVIPRTGKTRPRAGVRFPPDKAVVFDLAELLATDEGRRTVAEIESDLDLLAIRSDSEITPPESISRYVAGR